ncbi:unnamed protein product (mitochondrion) [Plasmodiophora brassicae]|uniref:CID domain-containing protein n=1 Tax=Plasmodiophora brassicae TaxID=37360 RepID=A0A0G4J5D3_PLABS|nr:hypothetical protein PBRA_002674 [Plasmodiophora brassicae]SPQ94831.1 unnamed protein product [Plasmodiophora brassicae]
MRPGRPAQQRPPVPRRVVEREYLARYAHDLVALRAPSRPQIASLTMLAGDEPDLAPQVTSLIAEEILRRPPRDRLPLLYLIDSITKNLAGPFIRLFVPRLHRLVLETFDSCPPGSDVSKAVVRMVDSWLQVDVFPMDFVNDLRAKLREPLPSPSTMPPVHPRPVVPPAAVPPPKRLRPMEPNWPALEADVRQFPQLTPLYRRLQAVWNARGDITPDLHRLSDAIGQLRMQAMPGPPPVAHHHHHLAGASLEPPLHDRDVSLDYLIVDTIDKLAGIVAPQQPETRAPPAAVPVFTTDSLRVRDQSVVDALYSAIPLQCAYCGLRIRAKADMATHLDWHFATNKEATKRGKTTSSQLWFMSLAEWVACSGADEREAPASYFDDLQRAKEASEQSEPEPVSTVEADDNRSTCAICGDKFEKMFDDAKETWVFLDAVEVVRVVKGDDAEDANASKDIVHKSCRDESPASAPS